MKHKKILKDYWKKHYITEVNGIDHCGLCGNSGLIDTTKSAILFGHNIGGVFYCICPNGRHLNPRDK